MNDSRHRLFIPRGARVFGFLVSILWICLFLYWIYSDNIPHTSFINRHQVSRQQYKNCTMKTNLFFLKVHKCVSGTTMVILWRFVIAHNLNPFMNKKLPYGPGKLGQADLVKHPPGTAFNVLANHVNYLQVKDTILKMMPNDTVYIGTVREPQAQFLSYLLWNDIYKYARRTMSQNSTDADYLLNRIQKNPGSLSRYVNYQSRYFGIIDTDLDTGMKNVFDTFDLIMIAEYYDESLILLKRYMCWDLKDIVYKSTHIQNYSVAQKSVLEHPVASKWFLEKNYNDLTFYQKCLDEFHRKVSKQGAGFREEVEYFRNLTKEVTMFCLSELSEPLHVVRSEWNEAFIFSVEDCNDMILGALESVDNVLKWQQSKLTKMGLTDKGPP